MSRRTVAKIMLGVLAAGMFGFLARADDWSMHKKNATIWRLDLAGAAPATNDIVQNGVDYGDMIVDTRSGYTYVIQGLSPVHYLKLESSGEIDSSKRQLKGQWTIDTAATNGTQIVRWQDMVLYITNGIPTNIWKWETAYSWVNGNSNAVAYVFSRTSVWNRAVTDFDGSSNDFRVAYTWVNGNSNAAAYVFTRTSVWDQVVLDFNGSSNDLRTAYTWVNGNSNAAAYVFTRTSVWDQVVLDFNGSSNDLRTAYTWVNGNSNAAAYVFSRTNAWDYIVANGLTQEVQTLQAVMNLGNSVTSNVFSSYGIMGVGPGSYFGLYDQVTNRGFTLDLSGRYISDKDGDVRIRVLDNGVEMIPLAYNGSHYGFVGVDSGSWVGLYDGETNAIVKGSNTERFLCDKDGNIVAIYSVTNQCALTGGVWLVMTDATTGKEIVSWDVLHSQGFLTNDAGFLITGGIGAWTNLSQYNNDAGFLVTGGIGAWTNLSQYNNDAGFLAAETQTLAQVLAQGNDAGGVLLTNVPSIWGSAGMQVDLENGRLYANDVLSFDWFTGYSYGTDGTTILIDRYSSLLNDWSGIQSLHWHNRYGYNSSSNVIFRWDGPQLADASGTNYYVLNHELAIYATGTPVYVESDPVYTGASNLLAWIGSTGGWTNLSQYNNDAGYITAAGVGNTNDWNDAFSWVDGNSNAAAYVFTRTNAWDAVALFAALTNRNNTYGAGTTNDHQLGEMLIANGSKSNHPASYHQLEQVANGNLILMLSGNKTTVYPFVPTNATYSSVSSVGAITNIAVLSGTNNEYTLAIIYTNIPLTRLGRQVIGGVVYASENGAGTVIGKMEFYLYEIATSNLIEWGEGGTEWTLAASSTPQSQPVFIPIESVDTNLFYPSLRFKRTGGNAAAGTTVYFGAGSNRQTAVSLTIDLDVFGYATETYVDEQVASVPVYQVDDITLKKVGTTFSVQPWITDNLLALKYDSWLNSASPTGGGFNLIDGVGYWFNDENGILPESEGGRFANPGYENATGETAYLYLPTSFPHSDRLVIPILSGVSLPWSVCFKVYLEESASNATTGAWLFLDSGGGAKVGLAYDVADTDHCYDFYDGGAWHDGARTPTTNQWQFLAFGLIDSTSYWFYVDGSYDLQGTDGSCVADIDAEYFLGSYNAAGLGKARYSQLAIYTNKTLTDAELTNLWMGVATPAQYTTNLAYYYPLDDGAGATATETVQANDGTLANNATWYLVPANLVNMSLVVTNKLLEFVPVGVYLTACIETGTNTVTTNMVHGYVSRDGGSTYNFVMLSPSDTLEASNGTKVFTGSCSVTNQPSGTDLFVKIVATNGCPSVTVRGVLAPAGE